LLLAKVSVASTQLSQP